MILHIDFGERTFCSTLDGMRRPIPCAVPCGSASIYELHVGSMEGGDRPVDNGSKGAAKTTVGLDLGDKYCHLCLR